MATPRLPSLNLQNLHQSRYTLLDWQGAGAFSDREPRVSELIVLPFSTCCQREGIWTGRQAHTGRHERLTKSDIANQYSCGCRIICAWLFRENPTKLRGIVQVWLFAIDSNCSQVAWPLCSRELPRMPVAHMVDNQMRHCKPNKANSFVGAVRELCACSRPRIWEEPAVLPAPPVSERRLSEDGCQAIWDFTNRHRITCRRASENAFF